MPTFSRLSKLCAEALANEVCRNLHDDDCLEAFARKVVKVLQSRQTKSAGRNPTSQSPWFCPIKTAHLMEVDCERDYPPDILGTYPDVSSWLELAKAILCDDKVWRDCRFCEVVDRHLQTLDWAPNWKFERDCAALGVDLEHPMEADPHEARFLGDEYEDSYWVMLDESAPEVMIQAATLMRTYISSHPEIILEAMKRYAGGCNRYFVAFDNEEWHQTPDLQ